MVCEFHDIDNSGKPAEQWPLNIATVHFLLAEYQPYLLTFDNAPWFLLQKLA